MPRGRCEPATPSHLTARGQGLYFVVVTPSRKGVPGLRGRPFSRSRPCSSLCTMPTMVSTRDNLTDDERLVLTALRSGADALDGMDPKYAERIAWTLVRRGYAVPSPTGGYPLYITRRGLRALEGRGP